MTLPPEDQPQDKDYRTFSEWVTHFRAHFLQSGIATEEADAEERAYKATHRLIEAGVLECWGFTTEGLYLYAPTSKTVVLVKEKAK